MIKVVLNKVCGKNDVVIYFVNMGSN